MDLACPFRTRGETKAIAAVAVKLLATIWHVLTQHEADLHAEPEHVATQFMRWSWKLKPPHQQGLQSRHFIFLKLRSLKMGRDLTHLTDGQMPRRIAAVDELFIARSDSRPTA